MSICLDNLVFFLRFSVQFDIDELLQICNSWMSANCFYQDINISVEPSTQSRLKLVNKIQARIRRESSESTNSVSISQSSYEGTALEHETIDVSSEKKDKEVILNARFLSKGSRNFPVTNKSCNGTLLQSQHPCETEEKWTKDPSVLSAAPKTTLGGDNHTPTNNVTLNFNSSLAEQIAASRTMRCDNVAAKQHFPKSNRWPSGHDNRSDNNDDKENIKFSCENAQVVTDIFPNQNSLNSLHSFDDVDYGWQKVSCKKKLPATHKISKNPSPKQITFDLANWMDFSIQDILRLCSSCCYPDFAKMEVTISWLTSPNCIFKDWQGFLDQVFANFTPENLSGHYLSDVSKYLRHFFDIQLPQNLEDFIVKHYVKPELDNSTFKYKSQRWRVSRQQDIDNLLANKHHSYFVECHLCDRKPEWQEMVLNLVNRTPCYDLANVDRFSGARQSRYRQIKHHHSNTAVHWYMTRTSVAENGRKAQDFISFITTDYEKVLRTIATEKAFRVHCLQIKSFH